MAPEDWRRRHFFVLGNGGGGTSLLRGLLNAHPQAVCLFEHWSRPKEATGPQRERWRELAGAAESEGRTWGNKVPLEQFFTNGWEDRQIAELIDDFYIVFLRRRFSKYCKSRARMTLYREYWERAGKIYDAMREAAPARIIQVAFEDLLLRTETELYRICDFLDLPYYEQVMLRGTLDTGKHECNQVGINREKL